ncbi:MAG: glutamine-hydrolyzing carbamoyl-phosphate synthase small subunit [Granulosicoccus sp.]
MSRPALLVLADGTCFEGTAIGVDGKTVGEVVFNTAMTGYQEILTDPSYAQQIVTLTYPHIGNTGVNADDIESEQIFAKGLIVRDVPTLHSNFRANESLGAYLQRRHIVAISGLDTRALTRHLRDKGAQGGCIMAGPGIEQATAHSAAQSFPGLAGMDLARVVSCQQAYEWTVGSWRLEGALQRAAEAVTKARAQAMAATTSTGSNPHIVAMDFGVKQNILRLFIDRGCRVTVVPANTTADDIRALQPDGLFLSNGPGDPEPCDYAINTIRELLADKLPTFGICLGYQLLALASGASTLKMKFGHHGANHPVLDTASGRVMISSQNHGFAVDVESLGDQLAITHISQFDQSLQGIRRLDVPAMGFQGHPEASPGPHDVQALFDQFVAQVVAV